MWLLLFVVGFTFSTADARSVSNTGKSFLLLFAPNFGTDTQHVITITSQHDATAYINNPNAPSAVERDTEHAVQSTASLHVTLVGPVAISTNQQAEKKAVLLVASRPVSVYCFSMEIRSSDGYLALPMEALGTQYVVATYDNTRSAGGAQIAVGAAEDGTDVTVTVQVMRPTTCGGVTLRTDHQATFHFRLDAQDTVRVLCNDDVTGSRVNSSKPVAVISGNVCAQVPIGSHYCDHLVEMMVPVSALGTRYLIHPFQGRDSGAIYRVVPSQEGTQITYGIGLTPLYVGDLPFHQFQLDQDNGWISADKPVMVVGYAFGQTAGSGGAQFHGDPLMTLIPSPDLAPNQYVLDFDLTRSRYHGNRSFTCHVTAVVNSEHSRGLHVGDRLLNMDAAEDNLSVGSQTIVTWPTKVWHDDPAVSVAMVTYCFADGEGIGFPAGYTLQAFSDTDECASSPCINGGVCHGVGSSYRCHCIDVFGGPDCKQDLVDDCATPSRCSHGGRCLDGVHSFTCACPPAYTGPTCNLVVETTTVEMSTESSTVPTTAEETTETTTEADMTTETTTEAEMETSTETPMSPRVVRRPPALCPCLCQRASPQSHTPNVTAAQQKVEVVKEIQKELTMPARNTSLGRSKQSSAEDHRGSATGVGVVAVSLVALLLGLVVLMDATTLVSHVASRLNRRYGAPRGPRGLEDPEVLDVSKAHDIEADASKSISRRHKDLDALDDPKVLDVSKAHYIQADVCKSVSRRNKDVDVLEDRMIMDVSNDIEADPRKSVSRGQKDVDALEDRKIMNVSNVDDIEADENHRRRHRYVEVIPLPRENNADVSNGDGMDADKFRRRDRSGQEGVLQEEKNRNSFNVDDQDAEEKSRKRLRNRDPGLLLQDPLGSERCHVTRHGAATLVNRGQHQHPTRYPEMPVDRDTLGWENTDCIYVNRHEVCGSGHPYLTRLQPDPMKANNVIDKDVIRNARQRLRGEPCIPAERGELMGLDNSFPDTMQTDGLNIAKSAAKKYNEDKKKKNGATQEVPDRRHPGHVTSLQTDPMKANNVIDKNVIRKARQRLRRVSDHAAARTKSSSATRKHSDRCFDVIHATGPASDHADCSADVTNITTSEAPPSHRPRWNTRGPGATFKSLATKSFSTAAAAKKNSDRFDVIDTTVAPASGGPNRGSSSISKSSGRRRIRRRSNRRTSEDDDGGLVQVEVSRFVESVAAEEDRGGGGGRGGERGGRSSPQHRGSRRKHLLHVRPDTIVLHVRDSSEISQDKALDSKK